MGSIDLLRSKAEKYLEKARAVSDRQRARLLLVHAHNLLKSAEETEAQQLSARRPPSAEERERAA
jgi:tmRNA-binding protein